VEDARLRVAIDISCLAHQPLTGVGYYWLNLLRALFSEDRGLDVRLFLASAQKAPDVVSRLARKCSRYSGLRCPTRVKQFRWSRLDWPPIEWFSGRVDISHGGFDLLTPSRRAMRVLTVFDRSGLRYPDTRTKASLNLHLDLIRRAVPRADMIVSISRSCKNDLVELLGVPAEKVRIVYGGVFLDEFDSLLDESVLSGLLGRFGIPRRYFIHLGTLEPRKNLPRLIRAYARLRATVRDAPALVLAGGLGWMYDDIFATIDQLKLRERVIHTGYLTRTEAVTLLRGAYACVYPSLYEGFGLPVLEALAARVPVLTSNVSSMPEITGDTAILVEPEDTDAIEAGLIDLCRHRDAALERVPAAYERASQFTWSRSADSLTDVYRTVVGGRG